MNAIGTYWQASFSTGYGSRANRGGAAVQPQQANNAVNQALAEGDDEMEIDPEMESPHIAAVSAQESPDEHQQVDEINDWHRDHRKRQNHHEGKRRKSKAKLLDVLA